MLNGEMLMVWFLASVRATGLMIISPVFSSQAIPRPVRAMMALFAGFVVSGVFRMPESVPVTTGNIVVAMILEMIIGMFMGWAVRLSTHAIELAGSVISSELGFSMGQQIDPTSGDSSNAVSSILLTFGSLVFLISGAHQAVLAAYLKSYEIAPVGMFRASHEVGTLLVTSTGKIFQVAVQMAAPLVAVNFIISLTFSILGKAAPAVQVFSESFAVRIVVGLFVLGMTLQLVSQLLLEQLRLAPDLMLRLVP